MGGWPSWIARHMLSIFIIYTYNQKNSSNTSSSLLFLSSSLERPHFGSGVVYDIYRQIFIRKITNTDFKVKRYTSILVDEVASVAVCWKITLVALIPEFLSRPELNSHEPRQWSKQTTIYLTQICGTIFFWITVQLHMYYITKI